LIRDTYINSRRLEEWKSRRLEENRNLNNNKICKANFTDLLPIIQSSNLPIFQKYKVFFKEIKMKTISQVSIFIENTKGRLAEVCGLLGNNNINIKALTIAESPEFGILRVVLNDTEKAKKILKENGFIAKTAPVVAVEVSDTPGGLAKALKILADNDINLEYMYGFVEKASEKALMVLKFDNIEKAIDVLQKNNIPIVEEKVALGL
jgi:hypothetical protein